MCVLYVVCCVCVVCVVVRVLRVVRCVLCWLLSDVCCVVAFVCVCGVVCCAQLLVWLLLLFVYRVSRVMLFAVRCVMSD